MKGRRRVRAGEAELFQECRNLHSSSGTLGCSIHPSHPALLPPGLLRRLCDRRNNDPYFIIRVPRL